MGVEEYKDFETRITGILKSYLTIMIFLFGLFGSVIAWDTIERIKLTKDYEQLRNDFGVYLLTSPDDHKNTIMYNELIKRYFPTRGGG